MIAGKVLVIAAAAALLAGQPNYANADATADLNQLFEDSWERTLRENPTFASSLGDLRYNRKWPDMSLAGIALSHADDRRTLARLKQIDRSALSAADQINYELFMRQTEDQIKSYRFRRFLLPLNQRGGIQTADQLADRLTFNDVKAYEDWIARLRAFDVYMDQTIKLMRRGIKEGRIHPRIIMQRVPAQVAAQIVDNPAKSPFFAPFQDMPDSISDRKQDRLKTRARAAIKQGVISSFRRLAKFIDKSYLPITPDQVGAYAQPDGEAFYQYRVERYTTTSLTADEIHEIGKTEVARIRGEMMEIIENLNFSGSFDDFLEFLRTDPQFYYEDPDELLAGYIAITKRIDPQIPRLFNRLPKARYIVKPIPDAIAPDTTTAYYSQPAADGSRPGTYFVNLYRPDVRPKYEMEVLSVHEAVPGHHLQIALAQELGDLPAFRRYGGFTAFVEGWGLYSESLGGDLGLYQDPYSKFGQLTYEMWRAVRLVVDTGMHAKFWPRQKAIDFFMANAAKTELDIINEIDRYIAWPGQALAYKIGELKIKQLRRQSEQELGEDFDIRRFHNAVLSSGAVPLDILEDQINQWLAAENERLTITR
ncbi:MAG: DUF885 domain-containing protein [Gammaproteobacteria bacterium]|nr:DUF885 domain-containing protein [Gammaproteobacteria bacterium]